MTPDERRIERNAKRRAANAKRREEREVQEYRDGWDHSMARRPLRSFHSKSFVKGFMDAYRKSQAVLH